MFKKLCTQYKSGVFLKWSRFLLRRKKSLFIMLTFMGVMTGNNLVVFNLLSSLAITAIFNGENKIVFWLAAAFFIYLGIALLISVIHTIILVKYREQMRRSISKEIINSLWENTNYKTIRGEARNLLGQLDRDLEEIVASSSSYSGILKNLFEILIILVVLIFINFYVGLTLLFIGILLALLSPLSGNKFTKIGEKLSTINQTYNNKIQQFVKGLKIFLFQGKENLIADRLEAISLQSINEKINLSVKQTTMQGSLVALIGSISLILSLIAGLSAFYGFINLALVLLFGSYVGIVQARIQQINYSLNNLNSNLPLIISLQPREKTENLVLKNLQKIELKKVGVNLQDKEVVSNLTLTFKNGKKYAIVGPSGVGKSSLTYLLLGLLKPTKGTLTFNGNDSSIIEKSSLRNLISLVSSTHSLLPQRSIRENLLFSVKKSKKEVEISHILTKLQLTKFINRIDEQKLVGLLSTGERQRLLIARALLENRPFLILDEALSNLDKTNRTNIENFLLSQKNLTLINITHHLEKSEGYDLIIELKKNNYAQN